MCDYRKAKKTTVPWFKSDGSRAIVRHALNQRKTGNCLRSYVSRIFQSGIVQGVRGEAWMVFDNERKIYQALTFGTLPPGRGG